MLKLLDIIKTPVLADIFWKISKISLRRKKEHSQEQDDAKQSYPLGRKQKYNNRHLEDFEDLTPNTREKLSHNLFHRKKFGKKGNKIYVR